MSDSLKLLAQSAEDLTVMSSLMQDATVRTGDIDFTPSAHRLTFVANRFRWEKKRKFFRPKGERVRTGLHMNGILKVQAQGLDLGNKDEVLDLLSMEAHENGEAFDILLNFAGGATLKLTAECVDAAMADLTEGWEALARPHHTN
ncbi:DUF2948 family protein [Kordiimonas gwangyangensis]|uniref:DUF2948 family protein n=1 Tax=Kordiimonas gwangyangensis TaxID=288022 RepID=UPI0003828257|nr:DUF2948 family protein [Kordiimonas gwangyangensis]